MSLKNKIKQYGWKNSFKLFFKSLLSRVGIYSESFWLLENNLSHEEIIVKMDKFDYSDVKELSFSDFKNGDSKYFNSSKQTIIRNRFKTGKYWSFGIYYQENLIYSCWITIDKIGFREKYNSSIKLKSNEGYLEDAYTSPEYRGKGLHSKMNLFRIRTLINKGRGRIYVVVQSENIVAIKSQINCGFVKTKKFVFISLFGRTYVKEKVIK